MKKSVKNLIKQCDINYQNIKKNLLPTQEHQGPEDKLRLAKVELRAWIEVASRNADERVDIKQVERLLAELERDV